MTWPVLLWCLWSTAVELTPARPAELQPDHVVFRRFSDSAVASQAFPDGPSESEFRALEPGKRMEFGKHGPPVQIRCVLHSPEAGRWWLVSRLRTPSHWRLRLSGRDLGEHGDFLPFEARVVRTTDLSVPLDLRGGLDTLDLLIWEPRGPAALKVEFVPDRDFAALAQERSFLDALVLGYLAAVVLAALFLWNAVRERAFAWYLFYIVCAWGWFAIKRGVAFQRIWPDHPSWNPGASIGVAHLAVGGFALFLCHLLDFERFFPRQNRILRGLALLQFALSPWIFACAFAALPTVRTGVEWLQALMPLWLLALVAVRALQGSPLARGILLSVLPLAGAMVYGTLVEFGVTAGGPARKAAILALAALAENTLATWVLFREIRRREHSRLTLERDFHRRIVERTEAFAEEVARDLHDDVGQRTYALGAEIHRRREEMPGDLAERLHASVSDLNRDVRDLSRRIHPPRLRDGRIAEALQGLCADLCTPDTKVVFQADERFPSIPTSDGTHLFRVVQEAVGNALRHGRASEVRVSLRRRGKDLVLEIADDGLGFDLGRMVPGVGLSSMESRARAMGGSLFINSSPGKGTRIQVRVPPAA